MSMCRERAGVESSVVVVIIIVIIVILILILIIITKCGAMFQLLSLPFESDDSSQAARHLSAEKGIGTPIVDIFSIANTG